MDRQSKIDTFTREFLEYRKVLERVISKILRWQPDEVADVLQDVWIKCSQSAANQEIRNHKTWMHTAAVNLALNHIQRIGRRHLLMNLAEDELVPETVDPAPLADVQLDCQRVRKAVEHLEPRMPKLIATLKLVHIEGHTFEEAAKILGIVRGTAKSNAFKAATRLRAYLTAENEAA